MGTGGVARDAKSRASALPQIGQVEVSWAEFALFGLMWG
jgi:hypothetical protein